MALDARIRETPPNALCIRHFSSPKGTMRAIAATQADKREATTRIGTCNPDGPTATRAGRLGRIEDNARYVHPVLDMFGSPGGAKARHFRL